MIKWNDILAKIKNFRPNTNQIVYTSVIAGSLVATIVALSVGFSGKDAITSGTVMCKVTTTGIERHEYVVDEKFDSTGLLLEIGENNYVTPEECDISYDFTSAGTKTVTFTYQSGNISYVGNYETEVYLVRHLSVKSCKIEKVEGEYVVTDAEVWADLNKPAHEFKHASDAPNYYETIVVLTENQYKYRIIDTSVVGRKEVVFSCGAAAATAEEYTDDFTSERYIDFNNVSGNTEKLRLYVGYSSNGFRDPTGNETVVVTGVYVHTNAAGNEKRYRFHYTLTGWSSAFESKSYYDEGLFDYQDGNDMGVVVNGTTFKADALTWHRAILNKDN